jgi:hypothetical protein
MMSGESAYISHDRGDHWTLIRSRDQSDYESPPLPEPAALLSLDRDRIRMRLEPIASSIQVTEDGGETWEYANEIVLRDDAPSGDLGYPASIECDDGTILTVYYQQEAAGEKTVLMTTRRRV